MKLVLQFVYGVIAIGVGTLLLKYNYWLVNTTGRQDWIERYMGSGSTYLAYKIFALLIVIGGLLYAFGLLNGALGVVLSPLKSFFPQ